MIHLLNKAKDIAQKLERLEYVPSLRWDANMIRDVRTYAIANGVQDHEWLPATYLWLTLKYAMQPENKQKKLQLIISNEVLEEVKALAKCLEIDESMWITGVRLPSCEKCERFESKGDNVTIK